MSAPLTTVDPILAKSPYTRPDKPEGPLLTKIVSSTSIECTWQPPISDGGTTLTGYSIQRRDITKPIWITVSDFKRNENFSNSVFLSNRRDMLVVIYVDL
jgi:hypothetical protein